MSEKKWYNSDFASNLGGGLGVGAVILSLTFGLKSCYGPSGNELGMERLKQQTETIRQQTETIRQQTETIRQQIEGMKQEHNLQERDLNENGQDEVFYQIKNTKYFSEIDGINLEDSLRE